MRSCFHREWLGESRCLHRQGKLLLLLVMQLLSARSILRCDPDSICERAASLNPAIETVLVGTALLSGSREKSMPFK